MEPSDNIQDFPDEYQQYEGLFPDHLEDLQKSGLTPETVKAAGLYSVKAAELPSIIGWRPDGVESALVFPYPGEEDGFCRVKIFPTIKKDGHTVKYLQRPGSGVRLYVPPMVEPVLRDTAVQLSWSEGEKKALKGCQESMCCYATGGLWNWLEDGKPIARLDRFAYAERVIRLYPDPDVWARPDLLQAVYAFGQEIATRGAHVPVVILRPEPEGGKLDEFLTRHGIEALAALKSISLDHQAFSRAAKWWKGWKKRAESNGHTPTPSLDLLERAREVRSIHPAQDFVNGVFSFGVLADDHLMLVTSERKILQPHELPEGLKVNNRGFDLCRFSKERVLAFLGGATIASHTLLRKLEAYSRRFMVFGKQPDLGLLFAVWTLATYIYQLFDTYPYLILRSPQKRCGKSRAEDLISQVAFNASARITQPTEAQVFRDPAANAGTLLLDEVEGLREDKERFAGLLAVLNSGFQRGGEVARMEKRGDRFVKVNYPTYAPRVLAGISKLAETLEDRGILVYLQRKRRDELVERFSPRRLTAETQGLRDDCYTWALTYAADASEVYEAGLYPDLTGLDDRAMDLWEPLMTIAYLADQEARDASEPDDFASRLKALAFDLCKVRDEGETATAKLIEALLAILAERGTTEADFMPSELLPLVQAKGFDWLKSTKGLAGQMQALGFFTQGVGKGAGTRKKYQLSTVELEDLKRRYGSSDEGAGDEK